RLPLGRTPPHRRAEGEGQARRVDLGRTGRPGAVPARARLLRLPLTAETRRVAGPAEAAGARWAPADRRGSSMRATADAVDGRRGRRPTARALRSTLRGTARGRARWSLRWVVRGSNPRPPGCK